MDVTRMYVARENVSFGSGWGPVSRSCEHNNKLLGSIQFGVFFNSLSDYSESHDTSYRR
jgi:hypothetical protein